jgi:hypothetical protein
LIWTPRWRNGNKSDRMRRAMRGRPVFLLAFNVRNGRLQVLMRFGKKKEKEKRGNFVVSRRERERRSSPLSGFDYAALQEEKKKKKKIGSAHR